MGNKQDELELLIQQNKYDIIGITETWWEETHDWNVVTGGYKLFWRDRPSKKGVVAASDVKDAYTCEEIQDLNPESQVESIWVRIKGDRSKRNVIVEVYYTPPSQPKELDDAFLEQMATHSKERDAVVMGHFNYPDICWQSNCQEHR